MISRRSAILGSVAAVATASSARAQDAPMTVYKSPTCGCCSGWVMHARRAGFAIRIVDVADLAPVKTRLGIPAALASCHTSVAGPHVFEGHVPLRDVRAFLARPRGLGLAVPGMPVGSPGMESRDGSTEPYQVLAFDRQGRTRVFARYG